jgi:hypothetical protein
LLLYVDQGWSLLESHRSLSTVMVSLVLRQTMKCLVSPNVGVIILKRYLNKIYYDFNIVNFALVGHCRLRFGGIIIHHECNRSLKTNNETLSNVSRQLGNVSVSIMYFCWETYQARRWIKKVFKQILIWFQYC